ncbi:MAG: hypothetical protein ACLPXZ_30525 [Mycobacterium sp.]
MAVLAAAAVAVLAVAAVAVPAVAAVAAPAAAVKAKTLFASRVRHARRRRMTSLAYAAAPQIGMPSRRPEDCWHASG